MGRQAGSHVSSLGKPGTSTNSSCDAGGGWGWGWGWGQVLLRGNSRLSLGLLGQPWGWRKSHGEWSMHPVPFTGGCRAYTWAWPLVGQGTLSWPRSPPTPGRPGGRGGSTSCRDPRKQQSHSSLPRNRCEFPHLTCLGQTHGLPSPLTSCDCHDWPEQPRPSGNTASLPGPAQGGGGQQCPIKGGTERSQEPPAPGAP